MAKYDAVKLIDRKTKMGKEFAIILDRCGCSRASLSFTVREAIHATLETGTKIEKTVPTCTPSRCFPTLYHFLYPNGGFTGILDMCKRSLKKHLEKEKMEKETSEWELGIHGTRFDEKRGKCSQCGDQEFIKNGKCRHCRGVCSDCGREDVPKEKLEAYSSGGPYLCADCTCSRMY